MITLDYTNPWQLECHELGHWTTIFSPFLVFFSTTYTVVSFLFKFFPSFLKIGIWSNSILIEREIFKSASRTVSTRVHCPAGISWLFVPRYLLFVLRNWVPRLHLCPLRMGYRPPTLSAHYVSKTFQLRFKRSQRFQELKPKKRFWNVSETLKCPP